MAEKTKEKLVKVIESISDKVSGDVKADDALKYTQAALNAANTIRSLGE
jgi:hypothetical protein